MTDPMLKLDEKLDDQNLSMAKMADGFHETIKGVMKEHGICIDEVECLGLRAFREVVGDMRRNQMSDKEQLKMDAMKEWESKWEKEHSSV